VNRKSLPSNTNDYYDDLRGTDPIHNVRLARPETLVYFRVAELPGDLFSMPIRLMMEIR
jgi:hypothetical protein